MEIILAKTAGFCFGVRRAIDCVYSKVGQGNIYTYGPIIHNKVVTDDLDKKGVKVIDSFDNVKGQVIIRSHGIPKQTYELLQKK